MYSLKREETETIVRYDLKSKTLSYYTCVPAEICHIKKLIEKHPNDVELKKVDEYSYNVIVPRSWYRAPKPPVVRNFSVEQRAAFRVRLQVKCTRHISRAIKPEKASHGAGENGEQRAVVKSASRDTGSCKIEIIQ